MTSKNHQEQISKLFLPLSVLSGVGPTVGKLLSKLVNGDRIFDLLLHKPARVEKISICPRLFETANNELIIIKAKIESHQKPATSKQPYKVICYNPGGYLSLVFFKIFPSQITKMPIASEVAILGHLQRLGGENQIIHPYEILPASEIEKLPKLNVVYPLNAGITQKFLSKKIQQVLAKIDEENDEWIDLNLLRSHSWPTFTKALKNLHYFNKAAEKDNLMARQRLAYDELLAWQIATLIAKNSSRKNKKFVQSKNNLAKLFLDQLPFKPTVAQLKAMDEIKSEIFSNKKMLRLLQGDVGSGKTIVAIASCLHAISQDKQACVIAPTTVLAKQHLAYFQRLLQNFGLNIELLTSANTTKQKEKILRNLAEGKTHILISTHAVLEDNVKFKNLGLAVIDEQHRFGVMQRLKLYEKGEDVDLLLMSATPIPRSLMMALYGDMDISILGEKPKNRQEISTLIMSEEKISDSYEALYRALSKGEKIYWICPAIEENEADLAPVTKRFEELTKVFGEKNVGLLHGKMSEKDKEKIMNRFAFEDMKILVSTTVIEVGIDVPDATIILIENAQRFGLSQLHQLRGRVGRSDKKSFCILLYGKKTGENGRARLNILRQSNDGFFIAEEDLKMRGSGDLLGTKQSGVPEFRIADLQFDSDLLKIARKNAELVLHYDPKLEKTANSKYYNLLRLFNYDDCLKLVSGG